MLTTGLGMGLALAALAAGLLARRVDEEKRAGDWLDRQLTVERGLCRAWAAKASAALAQADQLKAEVARLNADLAEADHAIDRWEHLCGSKRRLPLTETEN